MSLSVELLVEVAFGHVCAHTNRLQNDSCRNRRDQADCAQVRKEKGRVRSRTDDGKAQDGDPDREVGNGVGAFAITKVGVCSTT